MNHAERKKQIRKHTDMEVYQRAFAVALRLFQLSRIYPVEERYSLTDQGRRSSRSVRSNLAEAWRKRRYPAAFFSKLSDCESEAAEPQVWTQFAVKCGYLERAVARKLYTEYDDILGMLVSIINHPIPWLLK